MAAPTAAVPIRPSPVAVAEEEEAVIAAAAVVPPKAAAAADPVGAVPEGNAEPVFDPVVQL